MEWTNVSRSLVPAAERAQQAEEYKKRIEAFAADIVSQANAAIGRTAGKGKWTVKIVFNTKEGPLSFVPRDDHEAVSELVLKALTDAGFQAQVDSPGYEAAKLVISFEHLRPKQ